MGEPLANARLEDGYRLIHVDARDPDIAATTVKVYSRYSTVFIRQLDINGDEECLMFDQTALPELIAALQTISQANGVSGSTNQTNGGNQ